MIQARQSTCWGALPRRQRRLSRSSFSAQNFPRTLVITTFGCVAALAGWLSVAPFQ